MFVSASAAEAAFYAAFEARSISEMQAVWSDAADTLCIHPSGLPLRGWISIGRSWEMVFDGLGDVRFSLSDRQNFECDDLSVRFVHENIHHGPGFTGISLVLASNVFRREAGGWRIISHHGSPGGVIRAPDDGGVDGLTH